MEVKYTHSLLKQRIQRRGMYLHMAPDHESKRTGQGTTYIFPTVLIMICFTRPVVS